MPKNWKRGSGLLVVLAVLAAACVGDTDKATTTATAEMVPTTDAVPTTETVSTTETTATTETVPTTALPQSNDDALPGRGIAARLIGEYPVYPSALSPDGSRLFGWVKDEDAADDHREMCLLEVDEPDRAADRCSTGLWSEGYFASLTPLTWSPAGDYVAWQSLDDVWSYHVPSGAVAGVTDDGVADQSTEGLGTLPRDWWPAWRSDTELTFLRTSPDGEEFSLTTVDVSGVETGKIVAPTDTGPDGAQQPQWRPPGPVLIIDGTAYLAAFDVIHEVDLAGGAITPFAEYAGQYASLAEEFEQQTVLPIGADGSTLTPVGMTNSGDLLIWDRSIESLLFQTGGQGSPSGAFLLSPDGELTRLFRTVDPADGAMAPLSLGLSPDRTKIVVVWLDSADPSEPRSRVSVLDLATIDLPTAVRELPEIWAAPAGALLGLGDPIVEWTATHRISLQAQGPNATFVLQLEEPQNDSG